MAAKILHSLTDDNPDLQKQIGCMNGIFQLFDRQPLLTGGRRIVGHTPRRLLAGNDQPGNGPLEREFSNTYQRSASPEKYLAKNIQDRQRVSTESSRASFSSSSRSSSFSSLDCNRATQLEPASFDRMIFPETPSRDPAMSLQSESQFSRQSLDLKDLVKDSMYREIQGMSAKEAKDSIGKYNDSPRPQSKNMDCDINESLRSLPKLQETPWYQNEPRELLRSLSYHSKDGSSFPVSRDAPRFSYDGREMNRAPFDSGDVSKSSLKFKDLPRLSLDSREGSMRSLNSDSNSNFRPRTAQNDNVELDGKIQNQARPPSLVAKLMGLTALPDAVSSTDTNTSSTRSFQGGESLNISMPSDKPKASGPIKPLNLSSNLWKEPSSPSWRNPDSSMKPMSRFPIEPAPWKQSEGARGAQKPTSRSVRSSAKAQNTVSSVYSDIEKRLKDLKFTQSGKDLRALKQILEAMQDKGYLETEQEEQGSNYPTKKEQGREVLSSEHDIRSVNNRRLQNDHAFSSTRRAGSARQYDSPIVIMKPAKLVGRSGISAVSVIPLDGISGLPKLHSSEAFDSRKSLNTNFKQRDNAVNSVSTKTDRIVKSTQASTRSQQSSKDSSQGFGKTSGSISPRLQQKKLETDRRSRPPTPPDSNKSRKPLHKIQSESTSPGGRRRSKHLNRHPADEKLNYTEARRQENESVVSDENMRRRSRSADVSPGRRRSQNSSKVSESEVSGFDEKNSGTSLSEEEQAEFGYVPQEYSSPVSVLDNVAYKDYSPVKYSGKNLIVDASVDKVMNTDPVQGSSVNDFAPTSTESGSRSVINRKKLQNIESLIQKLQRVNSIHDEEHTDYIASLCENTNPDHRYISEILLASGLLLRGLGSNLSSFQFHPSGHPINPELFLVLEQTKASSLLKEECSTEKAAQLMLKEKYHRKLIFDSVNEILARKLVCSRPFKVAVKAINSQKLLRELCSEIEGLQPKNTKSSEEEDERWKNILCNDVMHQSGDWTNFDDEISDVVVLDIERLIFKDLVNEIVIGESNGVVIRPADSQHSSYPAKRDLEDQKCYIPDKLQVSEFSNFLHFRANPSKSIHGFFIPSNFTPFLPQTRPPISTTTPPHHHTTNHPTPPTSPSTFPPAHTTCYRLGIPNDST